ncbi:DUF4913 domain-containing protein [Streptomyces sp. NPDC014889]|uniref:DUF4913 domain-containing protein n=1 Tax=Streptomyces sp. NPDC014889 TaxID=3364928 RepID=UPI0036F85FE6
MAVPAVHPAARSAAYDDELRALIEWVEGVLVPGYLAEPSADARWCHLWFEHTPAVARLHALWLAWQELTDPASCGHTGPSVWHRDHLAPACASCAAPAAPSPGAPRASTRSTTGCPSPCPAPGAWRHENS